MDVEAVIDQLYVGRPQEFVASRDAAVLEAGRGETANQLKALRRPSAGAWLSNVLVRAEPHQVAELVEVGNAMRNAQNGGDGKELQRLSGMRSQQIEQLCRVAASVATRADERPGPAMLAELRSTLEAAVADPAAAQAVLSGRLVKALSYSGFGMVDVDDAVAVPVTTQRTKPASTVAARPEKNGASAPSGPSDPATKKDAAAERAAAREAKARVAEADKEVARCRREVREVEERVEGLDRQLEGLEEQRTRLLAEARHAGGVLRRSQQQLVRAEKAARAARS